MKSNNVNTISYNERRKKFDIFLETKKIDWAFTPKIGFGMDSQKLYANSSQRITIPRFMLLSYPCEEKVVNSDLFS